MDIKRFTDLEYLPESELSVFGDEIAKDILKYRNDFIEMIAINDFEFVRLVETPKLIKERYSMNVDIKGIFPIDFVTNDYILEIAQRVIKNRPIENLNIPDAKRLVTLFENNKKDLTIITTYLVKNIMKYLISTARNDLDNMFPELSSYDKLFIRTNNQMLLHYKISDYQELNKCSYETARKSMDKLAELSLYRKTKIGKKFVYQPTERLTNVL